MGRGSITVDVWPDPYCALLGDAKRQAFFLMPRPSSDTFSAGGCGSVSTYQSGQT